MSRSMIVAAVAGAAFSASASAGISTFNFPLSGDQEVPAFSTSALGTGSLTFDSVADTFDIDVFVQGITLAELLGVGPNSTPIHLHDAPAGANGSIAIDLGTFSSFFDDAGGIRFLAFDVPVGGFESQLLNEGLYVNIHTTNSPSGELRGQVVPTPAAASLLGLGGLAAVRRRR